jgi:hypothetical protein
MSDNPSPGLAVYRVIHRGESESYFVGSKAFQCDNIAEAAIEASGLRERIMHLEGKYAAVLVERDRLSSITSILREKVCDLDAKLSAVLKDPNYEGGVQFWIRKHDKMTEMVARAVDNPNSQFLVIYASLLAGMASSSLWSGNVGAGATSINHREDLANAAYEMAETAVRRLEKGTR